MRGFGRRGRGQGRVFVTLVRQTEPQLLVLGAPIKALGLKTAECLGHTRTLSEGQRQRLTHALTTAMSHHDHSRQQSTRLTQGQKLSHCQLVNADDPTLAPMVKGKSNCPAQFGRQPGLAAEPATGCICAHLVPQGNPSDPSYVLPMIEQGQHAIKRIQTGPKLQSHSVAGDLGLNDTGVRQALHTRGILTVGIPQTVESIKTNPSAQDVWDILHTAGLHRKRTPYQVHLACARGYSRPVVESHIASL
jgi:hypothetical protein